MICHARVSIRSTGATYSNSFTRSRGATIDFEAPPAINIENACLQNVPLYDLRLEYVIIKMF